MGVTASLGYDLIRITDRLLTLPCSMQYTPEVYSSSLTNSGMTFASLYFWMFALLHVLFFLYLSLHLLLSMYHILNTCIIAFLYLYFYACTTLVYSFFCCYIQTWLLEIEQCYRRQF